MPGTNQFLPFAVGAGANTLTPTAYAALASLLSNGFVSGVANSAQFNTALRQATTAAAGLAQFIANQGPNVNDDGSPANFAAGLLAALQAMFVGVSSFTGSNQSLATSGYQKLPGGLILQWGVFATSAGGKATLTFPIAFPAAILHLSGNIDTTSLASGLFVNFDRSGGSLSSTQVWCQNENVTALIAASVMWFAIGK